MSGEADLFADVEHGRFVALAFPDDDGAVHLHLIHGLAHGFDGHFIGFGAITTAHGAGGGDSGIFNNTQKFQAELFFHAERPPRRLMLGQSNAYGREGGAAEGRIGHRLPDRERRRAEITDQGAAAGRG